MHITNPLLAAKFQAPFLRPNCVERGRLVDKIELGCMNGARLTLICAPAGYGKTTLAVEWLQKHPPFAWFTLDERDNDPARFFTGLVTALRTIDPEVGIRTLSLLGVPQPPPVEHLTGELISELTAIPQPIILALDDYHHIYQTAIHDALEFLLSYQPANLHLLLATREDPAFPLGRLRANGQLTEIRAHDLRFAGEEISDFLIRVHHLDLPRPSLEKMARVTEGWAAGLQLAGLAIQNEEDAEHFFDTFSGTHHYIIEYLLDEVLHRQTEAVQRFLTSTAILERFNADLCTAVLAESDGSEPLDCRPLLAELDRANLFLTPIEPAGSRGGSRTGMHTWFRYHRLFADVLRAELDPRREAELHLRAAAWFETHDLPADAIPHYLAGGAAQPAARLIRRLADDLTRHGELQTLLAWMKALPGDEVWSDPTLLAYQALALLLTGDLPGAQNLMKQTEGTPGEAPSGALLGIQAWLRLVSGDHTDLQALAERALAALEPEEVIFRVLALMVLGDCYFIQPNIAASNEAYLEAYRLGLRTQHPFAALAGLENLVFNLYDMGQLRRARLLCQEAQTRFIDARGSPLPVLGMIDVPLSALYLEQRDLPQAEVYARRGRALCQKLFSSGMDGGDAETVLARVAFLQGRREEAFQTLVEMRQFAVAHHITALEDKMNIAEADLHLSAGDVEAARACLDRLEIHPHGVVPVVSFTRQVHLAEIHLFAGQPEVTLERIAPLETDFRRQGNIRRIIRLLGIKAAALGQLGRLTEALQAMEEAVQLAAPEGYLNQMLRAPQAALALLPEVRNAAPEFVDQALSLQVFSLQAPGQPALNLPPEQPETPPPAGASLQDSGLPAARPASGARVEPHGDRFTEPLSEQEHKILRLLAAGRSNQEIAEALVISVGTVKWHVHNILAKMDVSSRSQAAARARDLGLIQ